MLLDCAMFTIETQLINPFRTSMQTRYELHGSADIRRAVRAFRSGAGGANCARAAAASGLIRPPRAPIQRRAASGLVHRSKKAPTRPSRSPSAAGRLAVLRITTIFVLSRFSIISPRRSRMHLLSPLVPERTRTVSASVPRRVVRRAIPPDLVWLMSAHATPA